MFSFDTSVNQMVEMFAKQLLIEKSIDEIEQVVEDLERELAWRWDWISNQMTTMIWDAQRDISPMQKPILQENTNSDQSCKGASLRETASGQRSLVVRKVRFYNIQICTRLLYRED